MLLCVVLDAAPLKFVPQTVLQPDGVILQCYASGDEFFHWMHDSLGYTIIQNPNNGYFVYAQQLNGALAPTSFIPGKVDPAKEGLIPWLKESPEKIRASYSARTKHLRYDDGTSTSLTSGSINNLVVFIRFNNDPEFTDALSLYDGIFNDSISTAVSLRNYFYEVSYGALRVTSTFYPVSSTTTVISYMDSYARSYYEPYSVSNPDGYTSDQEAVREGVLIEKALNYVKDQVSSKLDLDLDDDGYVDNVVFIVYGNATGWGDLLWPHKTSLSSSRVVMINGAQCDEYNLTTQATAKNGASTFAHEMFHTLGSPDLYHYTDDGNTPVGRWDLMADNKKPPQHMTAYMKYRYGKWISDVPEITRTGTYELNPLVSSTSNCFKIRSPNSATEYFMLEYRKIVGQFEASLSSEGLLIYRINTTVSGGNRNGPPDAVYVFRPNGTHLVYQSTADATFCSDAGRTAFNNSTNPSCFLTDGSKANISISNIGTLGSTISFTVTIDSAFAALTSPGVNAQWVTGSTRTIQWVSGGGVDPMRLDYSTDNGITWTVLQTAAVSPYTWTVPNTPSRTSKIRIQSAGSAGIADSVTFAIAPPFHPLLSLFDATAVTGGSNNAGIVMMGNEFWTSRFNSALLHRWSASGSLLEEFSVLGVSGIRAMTSDSTSVFAVTGGSSMYKIDPVTRTLLETIPLPINARFATFDRHANIDQGGFWIGDTTSDLVLVNRQGTELSHISMAAHGLARVYGLVIDYISSYKPCLWAYIRSAGTGLPQYLVQLKLPEGTQTGLFHDVLQEAGSGAGSPAAAGLSLARNTDNGKIFLCGVNQGSPNRVFFYDLNAKADDPVCFYSLDIPYSENFDGLGMASTFYLFNNTSIPGVYTYRTIDNTVPNVLNRSAGATATGGFYHYGNSPTSPDRSLGGIQSSITGTLFYGMRFKNSTGSLIRSLEVTYSGEQWRTGGSATVSIPNVLAFEYLQSPKILDLSSGVYTAFNALSFTSPSLTPFQTALDGNNPLNRTVLHASIPVQIPHGEEIMLRWRDEDDASYDHSFAIDDFSVTPRTSSSDVGVVVSSPAAFMLHQNFPNPFNPTTVIRYQVPTSSFVTITVFDILGKTVAALVQKKQEAGFYDIQFNAGALTSGLYFYRFQAGDVTCVKKMILMK